MVTAFLLMIKVCAPLRLIPSPATLTDGETNHSRKNKERTLKDCLGGKTIA